jgi:hypothetical protein
MIYRVFQEELYSHFHNVAVWLMLRKHLDLKAYELSIIQGV